MIELKASQGAKPGHGGSMLPGAKVTLKLQQHAASWAWTFLPQVTAPSRLP
ncbi:hypothetical protein J4714_14540 [Staphylococcus epidermidis]|nr:hypothetical protein [Staphylococcus epidermidis]